MLQILYIRSIYTFVCHLLREKTYFFMFMSLCALYSKSYANC